MENIIRTQLCQPKQFLNHWQELKPVTAILFSYLKWLHKSMHFYGFVHKVLAMVYTFE